MSRTSTVKTQMTNKSIICNVLKQMGLNYEELKNSENIIIKTEGRNIQLVRGNKTQPYSIVTDWYYVRGINRVDFMRNLQQKYAVNVIKQRASTEGYRVVSETKADNKIRITINKRW